MRIPDDAIIADEKLSRYLLVRRPFDDKSKYLALAGFTQENRMALHDAIRKLANAIEAAEEERTVYGAPLST